MRFLWWYIITYAFWLKHGMWKPHFRYSIFHVIFQRILKYGNEHDKKFFANLVLHVDGEWDTYFAVSDNLKETVLRRYCEVVVYK